MSHSQANASAALTSTVERLATHIIVPEGVMKTSSPYKVADEAHPNVNATKDAGPRLDGESATLKASHKDVVELDSESSRPDIKEHNLGKWEFATSPTSIEDIENIEDDGQSAEQPADLFNERVNAFHRVSGMTETGRWEADQKTESFGTEDEVTVADDELYQDWKLPTVTEGVEESLVLIRDFAYEIREIIPEYEEEVAEVAEASTSAVFKEDGWVKTFLSRPKEAEYPTKLSLEKEIELQQLHVSPMPQSSAKPDARSKKVILQTEVAALADTGTKEEVGVKIPKTASPANSKVVKKDKVAIAFALSATQSSTRVTVSPNNTVKPVLNPHDLSIKYPHTLATAHHTFLANISLSDFLGHLEFDTVDGTISRDQLGEAFIAVVIQSYKLTNDSRARQVRDFRGDLMVLPKIKLGLMRLYTFLRMLCGETGRSNLKKILLVWNWAAVEEEKARKQWWMVKELDGMTNCC